VPVTVTVVPAGPVARVTWVTAGGAASP
jgi:hypothetical protein